MSGWRRRWAGAMVLAVVLAIGAVPMARDLLGGAAGQETRMEAYDRTDDPRVIVAHITTHPEFAVSRVTTDEDDGSVVLHVSVRPPGLWWSGGDVGDERRIRVRLDRPLGERQVVDGYSGMPVSER
ncbi:MAG: hypothetical protein WA890_31600 [Micromonospora sp.]